MNETKADKKYNKRVVFLKQTKAGNLISSPFNATDVDNLTALDWQHGAKLFIKALSPEAIQKIRASREERGWDPDGAATHVAEYVTPESVEEFKALRQEARGKL